MSSTSARDERSQTEPPLWSIGLAVMLMLLAPLIVYSLAPPGPLREGDTIFSEGQQSALLSKPLELMSSPSEETCLLDPGHPLIIIQRPLDRADGHILAQVQGNPAIEWPFCPPHAEVLLRKYQISQKFDVRGGMDKGVRWLWHR